MLGYDFNHKLHRCERGVVMVFYAILLPVLFGFMGLSLDAGLAYVEKGKAQDIADAAALAGAAKLGNNDPNAIKAAVQSFAVANGLTLQDEDLVEKDADAWDTMESVAPGHQAVLAYGVVNVTKDGRNVPRVRVRITKRVPVVFLSMVEGIANNMVVSAKAAAEGMGEEVTSSGPKIMGEIVNLRETFKKAIHVNDGYDFSLMAKGSDINYEPLPKNGVGTIYQTSWNWSTPDGYNLVPVGDNLYIENEELKQKSEEAMEFFNQKQSQYKTESEALHADKSSYMAGNGNKRYISKDKNNISPGDNDIDLYVDLCDYAEQEQNRFCPVLRNKDLKGVTRVKSLFITGEKDTQNSGNYQAVIDTVGISYGNIYCNQTLGLEGKNNYFNGLVYADWTLSVGGDGNSYWKNPISEDSRMFAKQIDIGIGFNIRYENNNKQNGLVTTFEAGQVKGASWDIYFGTDKDTYKGESEGSSGGSGSSSGGSTSTITTGSLRLVE